ncbi:MAG TPA: glycosyltransferase [Catalimonadaceae bacterium]|nr:glycosyltransferase [Catalimonadaceae bacterium]
MPGIRTILNFVDQISPVNFGIWHAAIATSESLHCEFGIESWLVAPESAEGIDETQFPFIRVKRFLQGTTKPESILTQFNPAETLVVTHGAWQYPTRWGAAAKAMGFHWIYTPHGMLEPWSMEQKWLKKKLYFALVENRLAQKADLVRAVGAPESENLKKIFPKVEHIANGIYPSDILKTEKDDSTIRFLYLARLHHKKGVIPLAEAWLKSEPGKSNHHELLIAGTDDGEKEALETLIRNSGSHNMKFLGPQFGAKKKELLEKAQFYVLPSHSEGFPTSVVEAMGAGLIPIITTGCNFPEAFEYGHAIRTTPDPKDILQALNKAYIMSGDDIRQRSELVREFAQQGYLWNRIAARQVEIFSKLFV